MLYALFVVLIVFSAAVGAGLADNGGTTSTIVVFTIAAVATMQLAFLATAILRG